MLTTSANEAGRRDCRYAGKRTRSTGRPITRAVVDDHADVSNLTDIPHPMRAEQHGKSSVGDQTANGRIYQKLVRVTDPMA
ncbi:hypothetical protein [Burkholderia cepacia]|uniref:hypothetical protein n=1 Tax=Burkholderia cepacia TaxID=292 RepID=UPI0011461878|nr:hypothetical protein [Burkholderia cepacia]